MNSTRTVIKFQVYRANISFKAILLLQFDISMHEYVKFDYSEMLFMEYYMTQLDVLDQCTLK